MSSAGFLRTPPRPASPSTSGETPRWLAFRDDPPRLLLMTDDDGRLALPRGATPAAAGLPEPIEPPWFVGTLDGAPLHLCDVGSVDVPGTKALGLRQLLIPGRPEQAQPESLLRAAGFGAELIHWLRTSRFCPRCAGPTTTDGNDWGRRCPRCTFQHYPRVSPCVIVLIHDDGPTKDGDGPRLLLVRQPRFPPGFFGLVAGFVEPGESLEECLVREVAEEVNLQVGDLRYFRSQPWPFPHQLMVGYFARYLGGELRPDPTELAEAAWFKPDALPGTPPPVSVAGQLIDAYLHSIGHSFGRSR